jgi:hypothetical protein
MPSVADALNAKPPLGAELAAAIKDLSASQQIAFALYQRYVFPLDGMNYWLRVSHVAGAVMTPGLGLMPGLATSIAIAGEAVQVAPYGVGAPGFAGGTITNPLAAGDQGLSTAESIFVDFTGPAYSRAHATTVGLPPGNHIDIPSGSVAWVNAATAGHRFTVVLHKAVAQVSLPTDVMVQGSFHYDSMVDQRADATVDSNTVIFTSLSEIQPFNEIGPDFLYIATYRNIRFAFASRGYLYEQADLYHYVGKAIYSTTATVIVDDPNAFNPTVVNSDSIPIWLYMNYYQPPYPGFVCPLRLYPAFLVDDNLAPPFGAVHVERTEALAPVPLLGPHLEADQLCRDRVVVHMYGADNAMAADFRDFVEQYSADWNTIGIAGSPSPIIDVKHPQPELKVLAQRKSITFDVNYKQSVSRNVARQYIEAAKIAFTPTVLVGG